MKVTTSIFLSENDVREIIKQHLEQKGYTQIGEAELIVKPKELVPPGAIGGDVLGVNVKVDKNFS